MEKKADTTYIRPEKPNNPHKNLHAQLQDRGEKNICDLLLNCVSVAWCQHLLPLTRTVLVMCALGKYVDTITCTKTHKYQTGWMEMVLDSHEAQYGSKLCYQMNFFLVTLPL